MQRVAMWIQLDATSMTAQVRTVIAFQIDALMQNALDKLNERTSACDIRICLKYDIRETVKEEWHMGCVYYINCREYTV